MSLLVGYRWRSGMAARTFLSINIKLLLSNIAEGLFLTPVMTQAVKLISDSPEAPSFPIVSQFGEIAPSDMRHIQRRMNVPSTCM
jgi:hypothetical protein